MKSLIGLCLLLAGCATAGGYKKKTDSWVGSKGSELVAEWGVPTNFMKLANGQKVYEFIERPLTTNQCATRFIASSDDTIETVKFEGFCISR